MTLDQLRKELKSRFPGIVICGTTADFYGDCSEGLWLSGEEGTHNGHLIFSYYAEDYDEEMYTMGVLNEVDQFLTDSGYFIEPNDPGTYMIWSC